MRKGCVQIYWYKNTSQKDDNQCSRENVAIVFVCNPDKRMLMAEVNRSAALAVLRLLFQVVPSNEKLRKRTRAMPCLIAGGILTMARRPVRCIRGRERVTLGPKMDYGHLFFISFYYSQLNKHSIMEVTIGKGFTKRSLRSGFVAVRR